MTLATHAVFGAAMAKLAPQNPILAFAFGFLSHYFLDAFPHGHYPIRSHTRHPENRLAEDMVYGRQFLIDLFKIGLDFAVGMCLAFFLFRTGNATANFIIIIGAFAGTLPDALQFVYWKIRQEPFTTLQKTHLAIHAQKNFNRDPVKSFFIEIMAMATGIILARLLGG
ncbi:MAG: hypothetical protein Q7S36_01705 [Candidatus Liptonbacteria bacterium]|nr:hypothetical protein [Candidatus Liptonbacteria bacterium]